MMHSALIHTVPAEVMFRGSRPWGERELVFNSRRGELRFGLLDKGSLEQRYDMLLWNILEYLLYISLSFR